MSSIRTFHRLQLDAISLPCWLHLVSPLLRTYATMALGSESSQKSKFIALAVEGEDRECGGLLLAEVVDFPTDSQGMVQRLCILSVVVAKKFKHRGLEHLLLSYAEDWAITHQLRGLHLPVALQANSSNVLLSLTSTEHGWISSPGKVVVGLSISAKVESLLKRLENVVSRQARQGSWQVAPFPEQQTEALQERITMAEKGQLAAPWDPDDEDYQWKPAAQYSRLVCHKGEIIGWLITHFVSYDCLRYAKLWVDPGWENSGASLAMLASVMRSAHFSDDEDVIQKGCFISHPTNHELHHWIKKQFRPVCDSWIEIENRDLILPRS